MKKWIFRILIFGFLFVCIVLSVYTIALDIYKVISGKVIVDWELFSKRLPIFLIVIFWMLIPAWIRVVSVKSWQPLLKKILISLLVLLWVGFSIYALTKPSSTPSSLYWFVGVAFAIYFLIVVFMAYSAWPRVHKETEMQLRNVPKRKSSRKNKTYVTIPLMTGTDGDATVTFINATFQKVNESKKRYPDPDFGAWLIEQIYTEKKIMAEKRGAFKKKLYCPSCDGELSPEIREPEQIEYELQYHDFDPFKIQITIPSVTCPQCGRVCGMDLDGSLSNYLGDAIIAAFKSENIKP